MKTDKLLVSVGNAIVYIKNSNESISNYFKTYSFPQSWLNKKNYEKLACLSYAIKTKHIIHSKRCDDDCQKCYLNINLTKLLQKDIKGTIKHHE